MIIRMNTPKNDIRAIIKYEFDYGHTPIQAHRNVTHAKGPGVVSKRTVERWFRKFREGQQGTSDQARSGRPPAIEDQAVLGAVEAEPTLSTRMLAADFHCSHMQIARILHKLGKKIRHGKWVPHELTQRNKNDRLAAAQQLLQRQQERPFLNRIVTCDEKWVLYKNFVNKKQWLTPGQPDRYRNLTGVPKRFFCVFGGGTAV